MTTFKICVAPDVSNAELNAIYPEIAMYFSAQSSALTAKLLLNKVDIETANFQVLGKKSSLKCKGQIGTLKRSIIIAFQKEDQWQFVQWTEKTGPNSKEIQLKSSVLSCYTDGSCFSSKECGSAVYFPSIKTGVYSSVVPTAEYPTGTNNRAELTALVLAVNFYTKFKPKSARGLQIIVDSRYGLGVMSGLYGSKTNGDLIKKFNTVSRTIESVHWCHVYAHTGKNENNDKVDRYAKLAAKNYSEKIRNFN